MRPSENPALPLKLRLELAEAAREYADALVMSPNCSLDMRIARARLNKAVQAAQVIEYWAVNQQHG